MTDNQSFVGWAILELMGHRRLAGWLSEQEVAGAAFVRLDVPTADGDDGDAGPFDATQLYAPSAVYCITPTNEETARLVAKVSRAAPVQRWEIQAAPPTTIPIHDDHDYGDGDRY